MLTAQPHDIDASQSLHDVTVLSHPDMCCVHAFFARIGDGTDWGVANEQYVKRAGLELALGLAFGLVLLARGTANCEP